MADAVISKGITLAYGENVLTNLQEIPELGGDTEAIDHHSDEANQQRNDSLLSIVE